MTCGILHSVPLGSGAAGSGSEGESEDARNVAPPGAAFGPSWRQRWWDYRNHPAAPRRAGTQRLQTTSWSHTPSHTDTRAHANECMFEYVYKGGGEGLDEPVTGVEWWHFCGISCLSLNICDTRLALEGCAVCLSGCVCVCVDGGRLRPDQKRALQTNKRVIKALSPFPPPLCTCQPTKLWDMLGVTVPAHSNNKPRPCLPSSSSHLGVLITALNFLLHSRPCPPQTNNLGGRILIIIASEKSDSLFIEVAHWPCRFLSISLSIFLCLLCLMITLSVSHPWFRPNLGGKTGALVVARRLMRETPMLLEVLKSCSSREVKAAGAHMLKFGCCSVLHQQGALWVFEKSQSPRLLTVRFHLNCL